MTTTNVPMIHVEGFAPLAPLPGEVVLERDLLHSQSISVDGARIGILACSCDYQRWFLWWFDADLGGFKGAGTYEQACEEIMERTGRGILRCEVGDC